MPDLPEIADCAGSTCRYLEFEFTKITVVSWLDQTGPQFTYNTVGLADFKAEVEEQIKRHYAPRAKCEGGCVCLKTSKILAGPTNPPTPCETDITLNNPAPNNKHNGFVVKVAYSYTLTVYEGICGPPPPKIVLPPH